MNVLKYAPARYRHLVASVRPATFTFQKRCLFDIHCKTCPFYVSTEAAAAGRGTERTDEEGAGHLPALFSDQPIHRHSTARLRRTQALCTKGAAPSAHNIQN